MLKIAAIPLLFGSLLAMPDAPMRCGMNGEGMHFGLLRNPEVASQLNLTEEQQNKLEDLFYSHEEKALDIRQKIERAHLELQKLMNADDPNENQIKTKVREIGSLRTDLEIERIDFFFQMRNMLSAEQIEKLKSLRPGIARGTNERPCPGEAAPGAPVPQPMNPED